jgi:hypothetical protein
MDVEDEHVTDLNLKPVVTTRLKRLIKDVKGGIIPAGGKSPTSVVIVAAQADPDSSSNPPLAAEKERSCQATQSDNDEGLVAKKLKLSPTKEVANPALSTATIDSSSQKESFSGQM